MWKKMVVSLSISFLGINFCFAQDKNSGTFPQHIIKLIVPFTPGGPADNLARPLVEMLNKRYGYQIIVENKPGANTAIAAQYVARSNPDGYTLLFASDAGMSLAPATQKNIPYDPAKDFVAVSMVAQLTQVLFVNANLPVKNVKELADLARKSPNSLSYATYGMGSQSHVSTEAMDRLLNIEMVHIPYIGASTAFPDLISGNTQVMMSAISGPLPYIRANKLKALAMVGPERHKSLPEVPTISEAGLPGFESRGWFGVVAPAKTPPEIVKLLSEKIWEISQTEDFISQVIDRQGFDVAKVKPSEFPEFLKQDRIKWKTLVDQMGNALN
ncbi:Bug family tripartite tricarboxylate transporter substrate binding protein [Polynucleobacter rarus]|uniref:Bug family tripartite tricarboxylate transporter substrate binding protein n=1 Tax=Polynucleobacter rarus TaxID=556055 RepID=UPI000D3E6799|nr:tripartite tricarboxylate transporter substrate binding protein [Polynucleobacter rarus]